MKTLHVIVCTAGSSKAVSNPASTGLHLLFFFPVSLVNRRTGRCCLTSAHMKLRAHAKRRPEEARLDAALQWEFYFFFKWSFWENGGNSNLLQQMKTKTDERSLNLPDESCSWSFAWLTFTVVKLLWKPQYYHNLFKSAKNTKKHPIRPKLYSCFDQCGICIFRCRIRL